MSKDNGNNRPLNENFNRYLSSLIKPKVKHSPIFNNEDNNESIARIVSLNDSKANSYMPASKRSCTTINQLNLSASHDLSGLFLSNHKRQRTDNDSFSLFNSSSNLQRPSSRISLLTMSPTGTTAPDIGKTSKSLLSSRLSFRPSALISSANSEFNSLSKQTKSPFYQGRTSFGGANLQKSVRRFSATPYALNNVNFIDVKATVKKPKDTLKQNSNDQSGLSSITQRVYEKMERASTPLQEAKRRLASLSSSPYPVANKNSRPPPSKLLDSIQPSALNNGRLNVDTSHKPKKYILTPVDDGDNVDKVDNQITVVTAVEKAEKSLLDKDIEKLNVIKNAEKSLLENEVLARKDITFGKISQRDVKKGRKLGDNDQEEPEDIEHFNQLACVKPLSFSPEAVKPLSFSFKPPSSIATPKAPESKLNVEEAASVESNSDLNSFEFSSPITLSSTIPQAITSFNVNFSSPILAESKSITTTIIPVSDFKTEPAKSFSVILKEKQNICDSFQKSETDSAALKETTAVTKTNSLENLIKKKPSNIWSCPTCCTDNEPQVNKCVACEEPNPNKPVVNEPIVNQFKFGSFSKSEPTKVAPALMLFKKEALKGGWKCDICDVENEDADNKCVSCETPNPNCKSTLNSQTIATNQFKFGSFSKPSTNETKPFNNQIIERKECEEQDTNNNSSVAQPVASFKFGHFSNHTNEKPTEKSEVKKNAAGEDTWICFYCKSTNASSLATCRDCDKIKTHAATKEEVVKFCNSQPYTFGFNKSSIGTDDSTISKSAVPTFKFGTPTIAMDKPKVTLTSNTFKSVQNETKSVAPALFCLEPAVGVSFQNSTIPISEIQTKNTSSPPKLTSSSFKLEAKKDVISPTSGFARPALSGFKFDAPQTTNVVTKTSASTVSSTPMFNFGSSLNTSAKTNISNTTVTTASSNSITSPIVFGKAVTTSSPSSTSFNTFLVSTTSSASLIPSFTFSSKPLEDSAKEIALPTFSTSSSKPLFKFESTQVTPIAPTDSKSIVSDVVSNAIVTTTATQNNPTFVFGTHKTSAPSTQSLFTFGSSALSTAQPAALAPSLAQTSASSGSIFKPNFNFGPPITAPKINAGEPLKLNLNFSQTTTATVPSNISTSTFSFVGPTNQKSLVPPISFMNKPGVDEKLNFKINIPAPTNTMFGSSVPSVSVPPTGLFNFNATVNSSNNNLSGTTTPSMFSFGASNVNQSTVAPPYPSQSQTAPATNAFNFFSGTDQKAQQPATFSGNLFTGAVNAMQPMPPQPQVQLPLFNSTFSPAGSVAQPPAANNQFAVNPATNPFQFSADQSGMGSNPRVIKKAKRRLK